MGTLTPALVRAGVRVDERLQCTLPQAGEPVEPARTAQVTRTTGQSCCVFRNEHKAKMGTLDSWSFLYLQMEWTSYDKAQAHRRCQDMRKFKI